MPAIKDVNRLIRNVNNGWMSVEPAPGADVLYVGEKLLLMGRLKEIKSKDTQNDLLAWHKKHRK